MFEGFSVSFAYGIAKDLFGLLRGRRRRLTPEETLKRRTCLMPEFKTHIANRRHNKLREDVIIRDIKRMDKYPDVDENQKGISPWFKVGLMDVYHRGIQVGLRWEGLIYDNGLGGFRRVDYDADEKPDLTAIAMGFIPFENIEQINWNGDEYYPMPHIYSHFDAIKKQPYEKVVYCEERELNGFPYYTEIVSTDEVRRLSKKRGLKW